MRKKKAFQILAAALILPGGFIALAAGAAVLAAIAAAAMTVAAAALVSYGGALCIARCANLARRIFPRRMQPDLRGSRLTRCAAELRRRDLEAKVSGIARDWSSEDKQIPAEFPPGTIQPDGGSREAAASRLAEEAAKADRDLRIFDGRNSTRGRWTQ